MRNSGCRMKKEMGRLYSKLLLSCSMCCGVAAGSQPGDWCHPPPSDLQGAARVAGPLLAVWVGVWIKGLSLFIWICLWFRGLCSVWHAIFLPISLLHIIWGSWPLGPLIWVGHSGWEITWKKLCNNNHTRSQIFNVLLTHCYVLLHCFPIRFHICKPIPTKVSQ